MMMENSPSFCDSIILQETSEKYKKNCGWEYLHHQHNQWIDVNGMRISSLFSQVDSHMYRAYHLNFTDLILIVCRDLETQSPRAYLSLPRTNHNILKDLNHRDKGTEPNRKLEIENKPLPNPNRCHNPPTTTATAHQEVETACQQAEAQAQSTTPATLPKQARNPKLDALDKFYGTGGMKVEVCAIHVSFYITKNISSFPENKSKVICITLCLVQFVRIKILNICYYSILSCLILINNEILFQKWIYHVILHKVTHWAPKFLLLMVLLSTYIRSEYSSNLIYKMREEISARFQLQ
ncbi:hypothetical protein VP01_2259g2 [Puccinia sorghi]|uniref:Uncharacterized protein n=1 Tax=Puccinia sorghi TaxID=27349 RepID=A0A0L6VA85_9BASI|nr:hypothetical protein VP01_2259g2 [Puccinia sorghi]